MTRWLTGYSLSRAILIAVLLPAALIVTVVSGFQYLRGVQVLDHAAHERALNVVSFLAPASEYGVISGNRASLDAILQAVLSTTGVVSAAILDDACEPLAVSGRLQRWDRRGSLCTVEEASILSDDDERLTVAAPVRIQPITVDVGLDDFASSKDRRIVGWVYIEFEVQQREAQKREIMLQSLGLALFGLLVTGLIAVRMARSVSRPVNNLVEAVGRMATGDLSVRIDDCASSADLCALQQGFNSMAEVIASNQEQLEARVNEATAQLAWQANHDPLTGLGNRRRFERALDQLLNMNHREGDRGALCYIDLDRFKTVNDTCGHAAGDALLKDIAGIIRARVREDDLVCRVGGDEFAVILHSCTLDDARMIADSLRQVVADFRFSCDGRVFNIGASIGLVPVIEGQYSMMDMLIAADMACYSAKKGGRNQVVESVPGGANLSLMKEAPLGFHEALRQNRLRL